MKTDGTSNINVLVMGVGRSGTTAIYGLLQSILGECFPGEVDFVYEPFLWDRKTFNKPYTELTDEFLYVSSNSVEGMYHHKRMPILADESVTSDKSSMEWLSRTLRPTDGKRHYLGKMIRANGRISLIRKIAPNTKIIFVIRNPIDVLNSSTQLFSFFGNEFYETDLDRFSAEVASLFGRHIQYNPNSAPSIEAEYAYWYFSNLAFLEYAKRNPHNILTMSYEAFVDHQPDVIRRICDFLDIGFSSSYQAVAKQAFGPVKQNVNALSEREFQYLRSKVGVYKDLLGLVSEVPIAPIETLIKANEWSQDPQVEVTFKYFNGLGAADRLRNVERQLKVLHLEHSLAIQELAQIRKSMRYRFVNWLLTPLERIRKSPTAKNGK